MPCPGSHFVAHNVFASTLPKLTDYGNVPSPTAMAVGLRSELSRYARYHFRQSAKIASTSSSQSLDDESDWIAPPARDVCSDAVA
jgi:hypothetical protein